MNSSLRSSRLRTSRQQADINPMDFVANIVDAMLVFACGLALSLMINWNVDVAPQDSMTQVNQGKDVTQVQEVQDNVQGNENKNDSEKYQKMGTVYKDPKTGKLFMMTEQP